MKLVVPYQSFGEWLAEAGNNRKIIDPCKINVFSDPAREALAAK